MEYLSVDRIEGDTAFCEDDNQAVIKIPLSCLPRGIREGNVLCLENGVYAIDEGEEARRRRQNFELFKSLLKDSSEDSGA